MLKYLTQILLLLFALVSFSCERELSSSYTYGPEQSVTLLNPAGGEVYTNDEVVNISWLSNNIDGKIRIELIREGESVYSVNNIPDTNSYIFKIPGEIIPSKKYQLKIESMNSPDIFDINTNYFEISPLIDGKWNYSNLELDSGLEIRLQLNSVFNNAFLGNGHFHLRYFSGGTIMNYEAADSVGGTVSYPDFFFIMREPGNKEFHFIGKMVAGDRIRGKITGYVDSNYGSLEDSITLVRE